MKSSYNMYNSSYINIIIIDHGFLNFKAECPEDLNSEKKRGKGFFDFKHFAEASTNVRKSRSKWLLNEFGKIVRGVKSKGKIY